MTARPASFEPLASSDPVPGDPYEVAGLGKRLSDTAAEIETQVANLRKLAEHSTEFWTSKAASKFHDSADDLAGRIAKAHGRYATTGAVLTDWSSTIDEAQSEVYPAVYEAQAAEQALQANAPQPAPPAGSPPPTADEVAATKRRTDDHAAAQTRLNNARNRFEAAVGVYNSKARQAADAIHSASSHDGLKDSWWDRNFHWISTVMKLVAIAIIVLAILAVLTVCPLSAGLLLGLGLTADGIETAAFAAVGVATLLDVISAKEGTGSWTAVGLDLLSLCTLGFGKLAESGVAGLAKYGGRVAKAVSSAQAGRAAAAARGLPGTLYALASRSQFLRSLLELSPKLASTLADADLHATAAGRALEAEIASVSKGSVLGAALTQSEKLMLNLAKLAKADEVTPGLRIAAAKAGATVLAGVDAAAQVSTFAVTSAYTGFNDVKDVVDNYELDRRLDHINHMFHNPLVPVP